MKKPNPHYKRKTKVKSYADHLKEAQERGEIAALEADAPTRYRKNGLSNFDK